MKVTVINCHCCAQNTLQSLCKESGMHGNMGTSKEHLDYCIIKISQNTEKSPGVIRRLAVTQTPVKNHQETLARKHLRSENNNGPTKLDNKLPKMYKISDEVKLYRKKP